MLGRFLLAFDDHLELALEPIGSFFEQHDIHFVACDDINGHLLVPRSIFDTVSNEFTEFGFSVGSNDNGSCTDSGLALSCFNGIEADVEIKRGVSFRHDVAYREIFSIGFR